MRAPTMLQAPIPAPSAHITWPWVANTSRAPKFVPALTTLAIAEPATNDVPMPTAKQMIRNVPVPGPKMPS